MLSAQGVPPRKTYDYWRDTVFYGFEAAAPDANQRQAFQAQAAALISPRANLYWYTSDPVRGQRERRHCLTDGIHQVELGLVLAGERYHQQAGDSPLRAGPGSLFFYDSARPSQVAWTAHHGITLSLDRCVAQQFLGKDLPAPGKLVPALTRHPLFPFFQEQMRYMAMYGQRLNRAQQSMLLGHVTDLVHNMLQDVGRRQQQKPPNALMAAAREIIHRHLANPALDATQLANWLGCSRATLYRVFAEHDMSVASYVRAIRLRQAQRLLIHAPTHWRIADIAAQCGFLDNTSFSRLFRQQFGESPREFRLRHRQH